MVEHRSVQDIAGLLKSDNPPHIIDVREPWEWDIAHIEGSELIPLSTLPAKVAALDPSRTYAMLCHHGMRSEMAANWMAQHGFRSLINIDGGIDAWSIEVDPSMPRY
jgi:rhodanese-related sulfurtransferase